MIWNFFFPTSCSSTFKFYFKNWNLQYTCQYSLLVLTVRPLVAFIKRRNFKRSASLDFMKYSTFSACDVFCDPFITIEERPIKAIFPSFSTKILKLWRSCNVCIWPTYTYVVHCTSAAIKAQGWPLCYTCFCNKNKS